MSEDKRKPEREKGAAPPDYMPAIFGWMTIDDQVEHAREITDFMQDLNKSENVSNADKVDNVNIDNIDINNLDQDNIDQDNQDIKNDKQDRDKEIRQISELDHRAVEKIEKLEKELNKDKDSEEIILIAYSKTSKREPE
ncbi:MAG: hypothetical protein ACOCQ1_01720 [Halanaerobiaceae bacterium]